MKVIVDTSALIALFVKQDINHNLVAKKYIEYRKQHVSLFISDYILDELFTRLLYDCGPYVMKIKCKQIDQMLETKELQLFSIDKEIFEKTKKFFLKFSDHKISFTDVTTYVLYKEYKLDEVFTLDSDFHKMRLKTSFH